MPRENFKIPPQPKNSKSVLIVDPQTEGHHLTWIRYAVNAFLNQNFQVTLMTDLRKSAGSLVREAVAEEKKDIQLISAFNEKGRYWGGNCLGSIAKAQEENPSDHIFMNELDLIASNCLRKAAIGLFPPGITRGLLSGVYFRPRFLFETGFSFSNTIKAIGFNRLYKNSWLNHVFLMDEQRIGTVSKSFPKINFHLLPDPWDKNFSVSRQQALSELGLREDQFIILQFGIGTRRKGIHLVAEAMKNLPASSRIFLLCAGKLSIDSNLRRQLNDLEKQNRAKILDRYVTNHEEELCFCAADAVLLPYVQHLGSSGVLSRAAASGKPVIASDYDLTGWRVRHHELGLVFQPENTQDLSSAIQKMVEMEDMQMEKFRQNALKYAKTCHLDNFKTALTAPFLVS